MSRTGMLCAVTLLLLTACGGGSETTAGGGGGPSTPANNVATLTVDGGPDGIADIPFVSVRICAPGSTTQCQTIDHVEVDTGSSGLRILSSVLTSSLALPQANSSGGSPLVECTQFADGYSWGPVRTADIEVGGETASSVPVQIIGDPAYTSVPSDCSSSGPEEDTVATFGANGILGVGPFAEDCGAACVETAISGAYYACATAGSCRATTATAAQQVSNPVAHFAADNNGVIVRLPAVAATGSGTLTGSLVFGIGTESNNALGSAKVYTLDSSSGTFTTRYKNVLYTNSFVDSGSSAYFFVDSSIATCPASSKSAPGFFCPPATLTLSATLQGANGSTATVAFSVANAETLLANNPSSTAFSNIGAPNPDHTSFDWGLPFFFGRDVYTAIEGANTSGGIGPYIAF